MYLHLCFIFHTDIDPSIGNQTKIQTNETKTEEAKNEDIISFDNKSANNTANNITNTNILKDLVHSDIDNLINSKPSHKTYDKVTIENGISDDANATLTVDKDQVIFLIRSYLVFNVITGSNLYCGLDLLLVFADITVQTIHPVLKNI